MARELVMENKDMTLPHVVSVLNKNFPIVESIITVSSGLSIVVPGLIEICLVIFVYTLVCICSSVVHACENYNYDKSLFNANLYNNFSHYLFYREKNFFYVTDAKHHRSLNFLQPKLFFLLIQYEASFETKTYVEGDEKFGLR